MIDLDVIDADGHVLEPGDVWDDYLPRDYRAYAPGWAVDSQGRNRRMIGGRMQPAWPTVDYDTKPVEGASDPHARLRDMDDVGIAIGYIYPSAGLHFGAIDRLDIVEVLCRAYNEWIRDFCAADRYRLRAAAVVPQLDVAAAMRETERAVGELGLSAAASGSRSIRQLHVPLHAITHPHEHQMACLGLICGQVLQKHPRLRVAFVESGCGWVPYWLERMEQHVDYWGHASAPLAERPTDYWQRQCFVSPFPDERMLRQVIDVIGADTLIYTTDYPYPYPGRDHVVSAMRDRPDVDDANKRKILHDNATRLYGLI